MTTSAARRLWPAFETYHAHIYFVPEAAEAYRELGLKGGWMGYFASRAAALGPASAGLVTAVFFNFHPAMVARALPDAWALASPDGAGALTDAGRAGRAEVEARTDELAAEPWRALGPERTGRLLELLTPMARAINDAGGVPVPNPVGVPAV